MLAAALLGMQLIPVQRTNPPIEDAVEWSPPHAREIFYRSCADCHSNETQWPWYSRIAPVSWAVARHVRKGRHDLNISVPDEVDVSEAVDSIRDGSMPPRYYLLTHPRARLSEDDKAALISGLKETF